MRRSEPNQSSELSTNRNVIEYDHLHRKNLFQTNTAPQHRKQVIYESTTSVILITGSSNNSSREHCQIAQEGGTCTNRTQTKALILSTGITPTQTHSALTFSDTSRAQPWQQCPPVQPGRPPAITLHCVSHYHHALPRFHSRRLSAGYPPEDEIQALQHTSPRWYMA